MDELYDDANAVRRVQPAAPPDGAAQLPGQPLGPPVNQVSAETDRKCRYAKELLCTISSCFETPVWATCCKMNEDVQCVMPNSRRSPDCLIAVVPENNTVDLRYPIFIAEVLGKKDSKGTNKEKFDGLNATMQSLVFAPRVYYCEIITSATKIYILHKDPAKGYLRVEVIEYHLTDPNEFIRFLKDICRCLIDVLVNLTPIAEFSAKCLQQAGYRDLLNIPSTQHRILEPHCWHLFVLQFLNQHRADVPGDFLAQLDLEDPHIPDPDTHLTLEHVIRFKQLQTETFGVTESNVSLNDTLPAIRAVRNPEGEPVPVEEVQMSIEAAAKNFSVSTQLRRLKQMVKKYRPSGVGFLGGLDEDEQAEKDEKYIAPEKHVAIQYPTEDEPLDDTIESCFDVELDGDATIISGGGDLSENMFVYNHEEGYMEIHHRDAPAAAPKKRKRNKVRLSLLRPADHNILFQALRDVRDSSTGGNGDGNRRPGGNGNGWRKWEW